ncbi:hypothetical protein NC653_004889 [Populus alba x Populus x berolinensis]|uniref:Uncharacterized protein n=1 Tax=Populus alba x Populus x berolinensis TaxID=444605 RepID=A0AAD6WKK9_9ROSI|nr:hypothetical protein NC653_004889 [Populus alba x Populus x berolinensis]
MATLLKLTLLDLLLAMVNMMLRSWWLKLSGLFWLRGIKRVVVVRENSPLLLVLRV